MSATPLYQLGGGPIDVNVYASFYSRTFDAIKKMRDRVKREGKPFFGQESTNLSTYKVGEVSPVLDIPPRNNDSETIPLVSAPEGYNKTFTKVQYRHGFMVTREAVEAQKTRMIRSMLTGLPKSEQRLMELLYAKMFDDAWATETTGDGSYVFATDHYYENPMHGQWSNKAGTGGTFTTASFYDAWKNLHGRKNSQGFPDPQNPTAVFYHYANHEDVAVVHGSQKYPDDNLNAEMDEAVYHDWKMVMGHWLTDENAWYVQGSDEEGDRGPMEVTHAATTYLPINVSSNPDWILGKRLRMAKSVGWVHSRNWYGNEGP